MEFVRTDISFKQQENFRALVSFLIKNKEMIEATDTFSMDVWAKNPNSCQLHQAWHTENDCGTIRCVAGWAAVAGLFHPEVRVGDTWDTAIAKSFTGDNYSIYWWIFYGEWYQYDNTIEGAIKRIHWMLETGFVPKNVFEYLYITIKDPFSHVVKAFKGEE